MSNEKFYKQKTLFGDHEIIFSEGISRKKNTLFEYDEFVEKFKDKKTTDDCYTPKPVYDIILNYLKENGKLKEGQKIIRPFFPGNEYTEVEYPENCIVIDNPPFSIFTQILKFYLHHKIDFFLFAPHLTLFSHKQKDVNLLICGSEIKYENGAKVKTSFASNLFEDKQVFSDYYLYKKLENLNEKATSLPKYKYPEELMTVSDMTYLLHKGVEFSIKKSECIYVSKLDDQKKYGKSVFGSGLLISKAKAKAKVKAKAKADENVNLIEFKLSDREIKLIENL